MKNGPLSWLADGHDIQRFNIIFDGKEFPYFFVIKGTNFYRSQSQSYGLKMDIFSNMPNFHVNVSFPTFAIGIAGAGVEGTDNNVYWNNGNESLIQSSFSQVQFEVSLQMQA